MIDAMGAFHSCRSLVSNRLGALVRHRLHNSFTFSVYMCVYCIIIVVIMQLSQTGADVINWQPHAIGACEYIPILALYRLIGSMHPHILCTQTNTEDALACTHLHVCILWITWGNGAALWVCIPVFCVVHVHKEERSTHRTVGRLKKVLNN
jgi:hypothetical protein